MAEGTKKPRADILNRIFERMDRLEAIGQIGQGGDIMIDAEEAATLAYVDPNTILTWGQNRVIPRYKLGACVRFGLREFSEWIASCHQPAIAEKRPPAARRRRKKRL